MRLIREKGNSDVLQSRITSHLWHAVPNYRPQNSDVLFELWSEGIRPIGRPPKKLLTLYSPQFVVQTTTLVFAGAVGPERFDYHERQIRNLHQTSPQRIGLDSSPHPQIFGLNNTPFKLRKCQNWVQLCKLPDMLCTCTGHSQWQSSD